MKKFEYEPWERHQCPSVEKIGTDVWYEKPGGGPSARLNLAYVDHFARSKHLTETECAAEFWRSSWLEHAGVTAEIRAESIHRAEVWARFVMHPHAPGGKG